MSQLRILRDPALVTSCSRVEDFLELLGGPACLLVEGRDRSRVRAIVTLLHGNEPSGLKAVFRWLKSARKAHTDTLFIIASVRAALLPPRFEHRVVPGERDLNRCFRQGTDNDAQAMLAAEILQLLREYKPEAVLDIHNTSGSGPGFGVAISADQGHRALVSHFCGRMVTNDLRLGALMEISEHMCPTVTIECGGRLDQHAHDLAWQGLQSFLDAQDVFSVVPQAAAMEIFHNPARLELLKDSRLVYADEARPGYDLTLRTDIESLNFGSVSKDTLLGWAGERELAIFSCHDHRQQSVLDQVLSIRDGALYTAQDLKLFMITANPLIALMDCLLYAVRADGSPLGQ